MYLLREGSASTDEPLFLRLPAAPAKKLKAELFLYLEQLGYTIKPIKGYHDMFIAEHPVVQLSI